MKRIHNVNNAGGISSADDDKPKKSKEKTPRKIPSALRSFLNAAALMGVGLGVGYYQGIEKGHEQAHKQNQGKLNDMFYENKVVLGAGRYPNGDPNPGDQTVILEIQKSKIPIFDNSTGPALTTHNPAPPSMLP